MLGYGDDRLHRREAEYGDEMREVARIAADRVPGEAVIAAGKNAHAAPLQILHVLAGDFELALEAEPRADLRRDAPGGRLVQGRVGDADRRRDEDAILRRLEHVARLGVGERRMVDDLDAMAERHLHR